VGREASLTHFITCVAVFSVAVAVVIDAMALTWVLVLALTLFNITATSLPCRRLFMQGLDNTELLPYAELSGTYHLITTNPGGFSKYQHDAHLSNFFFYNSTSRALVLGQGLLLAQTTARPLLSNDQYPYREVIIGWHVYQPSTKRLLFRNVSILHRILLVSSLN